MRTALLAAAMGAALAFPAFAQDQPTPTPPPQPAPQQMGAKVSGVDPTALDRQQVEMVQQALDKSGFSVGRVDGVWGPETEAALQKFQQSKNMGMSDGRLDPETLSALQLDASQFPQGQGGMTTNSANGGPNGTEPQQARKAPTGPTTGSPAPAKTP